MSNIIPFNYESKQIRVIKDNEGNPWWIASDVCEIIGLSNTTEALRNLDGDEKSTLRISEGGPERNIINEPGLYSLIIRSPTSCIAGGMMKPPKGALCQESP